MFEKIKKTTAATFLFACAVSGQDLSLLKGNVDRLLAASATDRRDAAVELLDELPDALKSNVNLDQQAKRALLDFQAWNRTDVQNGAPSTASGSTSAVLNPILPALFGVSFENGAITRSVSGSTVTLSANIARLICATQINTDTNTDRMPAYLRRSEDCREPLKAFSLAAIFDTARGKVPASVAGSLSTLGNQFASVTVHYELYNERQPSNAKFAQKLNEWAVAAKRQANAEVWILAVLSQKRAERVKELEKDVSSEADESAKRATVEARLRQYITESQTEIEARLPGLIDRARTAWFDTLRSDNKLYNTVAHGLVISAEYSNDRPDIATQAIGTIVPAGVRPPSLHTGRLIFAKGLSSYRVDFTGNVSSSWFSEVRPGMAGAWRDVRAAGDAKIELRKIANYGTPVLRLAGLWMNLRQAPLGLGVNAFNNAAINKPGNLGLFQAKLEVPTANSAVVVPISFTFSNRTELIKESEVRAQIGITLNLDHFFAGGAQK